MGFLRAVIFLTAFLPVVVVADEDWHLEKIYSRYMESHVDLDVAVPGGSVKVTRDYTGSKWFFNRGWTGLSLLCEGFPVGGLGGRGSGGGISIQRPLLPNSVYQRAEDQFLGSVLAPGIKGRTLHREGSKPSLEKITRNGVVYSNSGNGTTYVAGGRRNTITVLFVDDVRPPQSPEQLKPTSGPWCQTNISSGITTINASVRGFRWHDKKDGDWIEYGTDGVIKRYGDRTGVKAVMQFTNGLLTGVADRNGRQVIGFEYSDNRLIAAFDVPASGDSQPVRRVEYEYSPDSNKHLVKVRDVRGSETVYAYSIKLPYMLASIVNPDGKTRSVNGHNITETDGTLRRHGFHYDDGRYSQTRQKFYYWSDIRTVNGQDDVYTWVYSDKLELVKELRNGKLVRSHSHAGRNVTTLDGAGRKTVVSEDDFGNVTRTVFPDGSIASAKYSSVHGQILEQVDEAGVKTKYEYDETGKNLVKVTEALGRPEKRVTVYTHDAEGRVLTETVQGAVVSLPGGATVTVADATTAYTYDANGNVETITNPEGGVESYTYNRQGQVLQTTDARGKVWVNEYDAAGNLIRQTNPLGQFATATYDGLNRRVTTTDAMGGTTHYRYNAQGELVYQRNPLGHEQQWHYDAWGRLTQTIDELSNVANSQTYGRNGLPQALTDANGNTISFSYDDGGQLIEAQVPTYRAAFENNGKGLPVLERDILDEATAYTRAHSYDLRGLQTQRTDRNGHITQQRYDALRRLIEFTDADGTKTRYTYDSRDNLLAITDAKGNTTRYTYDRNDQLVAEQRPEGQMLSYQYDADGNLVQQTDAKGNLIVLVYDDAGRLASESYTPAGGSVAERSISYSYNAAGTLTGWQDNNQAPGAQPLSAAYTVDALQRVTAETVTYGAISATTRTEYYPTGQVYQRVYPDGYTVSHGYDAGGNLTTLTLPEGSINYQQMQWNQPRLVQFPGGSTQAREYDALMRLKQIETKAPGEAERYRLTNTYDPESSITAQTGTHGSASFSYDNRYRLTGADYSNGLTDEAWTYDALGNRLTDTRRGAGQPWVYNQNNQLLQSRAQNGALVTHSYDANGSQLSKSGAATEPGLNLSNHYDAANRLTEVRDSQSQLLARYQYDPFGQRISKTVYSSGSPVTTYFVYAEEGLLAELDSNGLLQRAYGWMPDTDYGTEPQFIRTRPVGAPASSPLMPYYYQTDALGVARSIIDGAGEVVWSQKAYAFGETGDEVVGVIVNPLRFPGQYHDEETGQHYNYFRDYDPAIGRYIQHDPIGLDGGLNVYGYAEQDPLMTSDPYGLLAPIGVAAMAALRCHTSCMIGKAIADPCFDASKANKVCIKVCLNPLNWLGKGKGKGKDSVGAKGINGKPKTGKTDPHANQKRKEVAQKRYNDLRDQLHRDSMKPNKTPQEKKALEKLEAKVKDAKRKADESGETHWMRGK